ncbi:MAG: SAM-dependent methyltransferase [Alphaproteobacteria bacterium]|nr:SAM-dependent methyltransferase [Alphaproteobacteria bacterium]
MPSQPACLVPAPSPWIARWAALIYAGGTVLDVACGSGRHLRHFLARDHKIVGLDRDIAGLADLRGDPLVEIVQADLENGAPWPLPGRRFAGIVVTNYLHRPLFPTLVEALEPGGALLYETFAAGNQKYGKPSNPDFLLREGELLDVVRGKLRVVAYEAVEEETPRRAVVQRIAAIRPKD